MVYEITLSPRTHLRLVRNLGGLSGEEERVYDALRDMEGMLRGEATRQTLVDCVEHNFPKIYGIYSIIEGNDHKPEFHKWYHALLDEFNERIRNDGT